MGDYETTRQRHLGYLGSVLPGHVGRLMWSAEMIAQERQERLRALLRVAQERSPWHAARLRGIDPDTFREDGLSRLPPMNKSDLMASWDAIVTDRRVTLDQADAHVSGLTSDAYLQDDLHVVASGGSAGRSGPRRTSACPAPCCGTARCRRSWPVCRAPSASWRPRTPPT
jgi:phenylacetate-CoA ligase